MRVRFCVSSPLAPLSLFSLHTLKGLKISISYPNSAIGILHLSSHITIKDPFSPARMV